MTNDLMLVGSIAYDTAEDTFRSIAPSLGQWLPFIPDGEIGDRQYWITFLAYRVFHGHPDIETLARPRAADGRESWNRDDWGGEGKQNWQFRVKPEVDQVRFGDPGRRLGYARDAITSYFVFKTLRSDGVIPSDVKFQISIPLTASCVRRFFPDPDDYPKIRDGLTEALAAEVKTIVDHIPNDDLVIQWDCAIEDTLIERALIDEGKLTPKVQSIADELFKPARDVCAEMPDAVELGYHACYGTAEGWPVREPQDLTGVVLLCNAAVAASGRRVDFLHIPTVAGDHPAYVAPLAQLNTEGARVYMGLIHALHEGDGMRKQMENIKAHIGEFGIAAPCGFGRGPGKMSSQQGLATANDYMEGIIADHISAVELLHQVRG